LEKLLEQRNDVQGKRALHVIDSYVFFYILIAQFIFTLYC
jgi:hypothetical protein